MNAENLMQTLGIERVSGAAATLCDDLAEQAAKRTHDAIMDAIKLATLEGIPPSQRASMTVSIAGAAAASAVCALAVAYGAALGLSLEEARSPRMRRIVIGVLVHKMDEEQRP